MDETRAALGIDAAVGDDWKGKPLLYHLKATPHSFLKAMHFMSVAQHVAGRKACALFPLRRSLARQKEELSMFHSKAPRLAEYAAFSAARRRRGG